MQWTFIFMKVLILKFSFRHLWLVYGLTILMKNPLSSLFNLLVAVHAQLINFSILCRSLWAPFLLYLWLTLQSDLVEGILNIIRHSFKGRQFETLRLFLRDPNRLFVDFICSGSINDTFQHFIINDNGIIYPIAMIP